MNKYAKLKLNRLYEAFFTSAIDILAPSAQEPQEKAFEMESLLAGARVAKEGQYSGPSQSDFDYLTAKIKQQTEEIRQQKELFAQTTQRNYYLEHQLERMQAADPAARDTDVELQNANIYLMYAVEENKALQEEVQYLKDREMSQRERMSYLQQENYRLGMTLQKSSATLPDSVQQYLDVLKYCEKMLYAEDESEYDAAEQVRKFVEAQLQLREAGIFITFNDYDKLNQVSDQYEALQAQLNLSGYAASPQKNRLPDVYQQNFFQQLTAENAQLSDKLQQLENENMVLKTRVSEVYEVNLRYEYQLSKKGVFRKENTRYIELETRLKQQQLLIYQLQDKMRTERNSRVSQFRESQIEQPTGFYAFDAPDEQALKQELDNAKRGQRRAEDELIYCYEKLKLVIRKNDAVFGQIDVIKAESAEVYQLQNNAAETLRRKLDELEAYEYQHAQTVSAEQLGLEYRISALQYYIAEKDESIEAFKAAFEKLYVFYRGEAKEAESKFVQMRSEVYKIRFERDELYAQIYRFSADKYTSSALATRNEAEYEVMTLKRYIEALNGYLQEREYYSVYLVPESYVLLLRQNNNQLYAEVYSLRKDIKKLREKAQRLHAAEAASYEANARCEVLSSELERYHQVVDRFQQQVCEHDKQVKTLKEAKEELQRYLAEYYRIVYYHRKEASVDQNGSDIHLQPPDTQQHRIEELEQLLQERAHELLKLRYSNAAKEKALMERDLVVQGLNEQIAEIRNRLGAQVAEHKLELTYLYDVRLQFSRSMDESLRTDRFLANSFEEVGRWNYELLYIKAGLRMTKMLYYQANRTATETLAAAAVAVKTLLARTFAANTLSESRTHYIVIKQLQSDLQDQRLENQLLSLQLYSEDGAIYKSRISQLEQLGQRQGKRILAFYKQVLRYRRAEDAVYRFGTELRMLKVELAKTKAYIAKQGVFPALHEVEAVCTAVRPQDVRESGVYTNACVSSANASTQSDNLAVLALRNEVTGLYAAIHRVRQQVAGFSYQKSIADVRIQGVLTSCHRLTLRFQEQQLDAEETERLRYRCLDAEYANAKLEKALVYAKMGRNNWLFKLKKCRDQLLRQVEEQDAGIRGLESRICTLAIYLQGENDAVRIFANRNIGLARVFLGFKQQLGIIESIKASIVDARLVVSRSMRLDVSHVLNALQSATSGQKVSLQQLNLFSRELDAKSCKIQELSAKVLDYNYRYNTLKDVYDATKAQLLLAERRTDEAMKQGRRSKKVQEELELKVSDLAESNQELYNSAILLETRLRAQEGQTRLQKLRKQENQLVASLTASYVRKYPQIAQKLDAGAIAGMVWTADTVLIAVRALFGKHFSKQLIQLYRRKAAYELVRQLTLAQKKIQLCCEMQLSTELRSQAFADVCDFVCKLVEEKGGLGV